MLWNLTDDLPDCAYACKLCSRCIVGVDGVGNIAMDLGQDDDSETCVHDLTCVGMLLRS